MLHVIRTFSSSTHNSAGMKPLRVGSCGGAIETVVAGVGGATGRSADAVSDVVVAGVPVSVAMVIGTDCAVVLAIKLEKDVSASPTDVLLLDGNAISLKSFQSGRLPFPGKSRMLSIVSSCSSLSAGSCEARRPSNSAAHTYWLVLCHALTLDSRSTNQFSSSRLPCDPSWALLHGERWSRTAALCTHNCCIAVAARHIVIFGVYIPCTPCPGLFRDPKIPDFLIFDEKTGGERYLCESPRS